jgi:hypothetical protein
MSLEFIQIFDRGDFEKERVAFRVTDITNLLGYIILNADKFVDRKTFYSSIPCAFMFPATEVVDGDTVVIYSKKGTDKKRPNANGKSTLFYYWNQDSPIWTSENKVVVVGHLDFWRVLYPDDYLGITSDSVDTTESTRL